MLTHETLESYDTYPYNDEPFSNTHPENLAAIGRLFGIDTPCTTKCRILELGAAKGGNIMGIAYSLPSSECIGVDLSLRQVQEGTQLLNSAGISNLKLQHVNILDVKWDFGSFDYIIAHGLLSWVPPNVRVKIFEICKQLLTPNGICYFSYNTYPGWKSRDIFRELMFFEAGNFASFEELAKKSRRAVQITNAVLQENNSQLSQHLKNELSFYLGRPDWYYLHDFVAEYNQPFYISEICKMASEHELTYFADTELSTCTLLDIPVKTRALLSQLSSDRVAYEQYLDIARLRAFRRSLFCRAGNPITFDNQIQNLENIWLAARFTISKDHSTGETIYAASNGTALKMKTDAAAQVLQDISNTWPKHCSIRQLTNGYSESQRKIILNTLLQGIYANMFMLGTTAGIASNRITDYPKASMLAIEQSHTSNTVTSLHNTPIPLDEFEKKVLRVLNGEKSLETCSKKIFENEIESANNFKRFHSTVKKFLDNALLVDC